MKKDKYILVDFPVSQCFMDHDRWSECLAVEVLDDHPTAPDTWMVPEDLYYEVMWSCEMKDGDVYIVELTDNRKWAFIYKESNHDLTSMYAAYCFDDDFFESETSQVSHNSMVKRFRKPSELELQVFWDTLQFNGLSWNAENKKLTKESKQGKFDIQTLKPYDKILKREYGLTSWWYPTMVSYVTSYEVYTMDSQDPAYAVLPFEGNEHLVGTCKDCDEYYKFWE